MNKNPLFNQRLLNDYYKKIDIPDDKYNDLVEKVFNLPEKSITMGKKSGNEENVKNKVVLQILKFLGFDEQLDLNYEVSTLRKSIDVAIKLSEEETTSTALIEVKYWKKNLSSCKY